MAFTRKKAAKAAPARASYAKRKMKEQEEEVQEEIIEEEAEQEQEQDDYQEETPEPPRGYAKQVQQMQTRNTSYGNRSTRGNNTQSDRKALRLTGLFAGKREGLYSGRLRDEDAENLKALIEEAQSQGQQISFFLWENQGNPQFSLTANIAVQKSFGGRSGGFRRGGFNR